MQEDMQILKKIKVIINRSILEIDEAVNKPHLNNLRNGKGIFHSRKKLIFVIFCFLYLFSFQPIRRHPKSIQTQTNST
jgi:hypothetical protein